jgi:hypothetical protein
MANIQNLRIGPCSLVWKTQDLGHTLGGVKLTYERKLTDLKVDKYGDSPVDSALTSTMLQIAFKVAEPVAALIQRIIPEGSNNTGGLGQQVGFAAGEGDTMRKYAGLLTMHPLSKVPTDTSEDITVYLAYPSGNTVLNYDANNQRVYEVTMGALVDEEFTAGRRLGHIGPVSIS